MSWFGSNLWASKGTPKCGHIQEKPNLSECACPKTQRSASNNGLCAPDLDMALSLASIHFSCVTFAFPISCLFFLLLLLLLLYVLFTSLPLEHVHLYVLYEMEYLRQAYYYTEYTNNNNNKNGHLGIKLCKNYNALSLLFISFIIRCHVRVCGCCYCHYIHFVSFAFNSAFCAIITHSASLYCMYRWWRPLFFASIASIALELREFRKRSKIDGTAREREVYEQHCII